MRTWNWLLCASLAAALAVGGASSRLLAAGLTIEEFESLHEELRPSPAEAWRTIPWKIALLDAQRAAAKEGKPIFIWAMDGHPLGCT